MNSFLSLSMYMIFFLSIIALLTTTFRINIQSGGGGSSIFVHSYTTNMIPVRKQLSIRSTSSSIFRILTTSIKQVDRMRTITTTTTTAMLPITKFYKSHSSTSLSCRFLSSSIVHVPFQSTHLYHSTRTMRR